MKGNWIKTLIAVFLMIAAGGISWSVLHGKNPVKFGLDISGGVIVEYTPDLNEVLDAYSNLSNRELLELAKEVLQSRLHTKLRIAPDVVIRGDNSILVSVPSIDNPKKVLDIVGQTFNLTFRLVLKEYDDPPSSVETYRYRGSYLRLGKTEFSADMLDLSKVKVIFDNGKPVVGFSFKESYAKKFGTFTSNHVGERLAILVDNHVEMAPVISEAITDGSGVISGDYSVESAHDVAMLLRSGAIPVSLRMESIRAIGPSLGQQVKESGIIAMLLTVICLLIVITIAYQQRVWLLFSALASIFCLLLSILGLVSLIGFTLDIAAVAGAILTIGMGIDALVIIFESLEIRLRNFSPPEISSFYGRIIRRIYSFSGDGRVLLHSNLTTIIAVIPILYVERLRFLALFIVVGVTASIITIFFTREVLQTTHVLSPKTGISLLGWMRGRKMGIFSFRNVLLPLTGIACLATLVVISLTILGRDFLRFGDEFHPGTQLIVRAKKNVAIDSAIDQVRKQFPDAMIRYQKIASLSNKDTTFADHDYLVTINQSLYARHRAQEKKSAVEIASEDQGSQSGLFEAESLQAVFSRLNLGILSINSISSKLSSRNMLKALSVIIISFFLITIYLLFFQGAIDKRLPILKVQTRNDDQMHELGGHSRKPLSTTWTSFGIVVAVIHDILIMLLFCWILDIDISLPVIAAILTMMGYSVNDSVVLWAHIQNLYEMREPPKSKNEAVSIVSQSIDSVFVRTILTSITTIIPAISIIAVGIVELTDFAAVIFVGVISGTFSSMFIVGSFAVESITVKITPPEPDISLLKRQKEQLTASEFEERMKI
jgi:SecD/SecF fusion protein